MMSTAKPLSISFYVPQPTPTPLPPRRPAFLTKSNVLSGGLDVISSLRRQQALSVPKATEQEEEEVKALRNIGVEVDDLALALSEVERATQMQCIRVVLLPNEAQLAVVLQAGLRYRLCLHGVAPRFNLNVEPVRQSPTWTLATRSPGSSPERTRLVAGDSGVSFVGQDEAERRKRADSCAAPLAWALFEEPTDETGTATRGRLVQRSKRA